MPDARWNDPRDYGDLDRGGERARTDDDRDRDDHDPRDALMPDMDLRAAKNARWSSIATAGGPDRPTTARLSTNST
jgi:hypothetical protein